MSWIWFRDFPGGFGRVGHWIFLSDRIGKCEQGMNYVQLTSGNASLLRECCLLGNKRKLSRKGNGLESSRDIPIPLVVVG